MDYRMFALLLASSGLLACTDPADAGPGYCTECECFPRLDVDLRLLDDAPPLLQVRRNGEIVVDDCDPDLRTLAAVNHALSAGPELVLEFGDYDWEDHEFIDIEVFGRQSCARPWRLLAAYYDIETAPDVDRSTVYEGPWGWCAHSLVRLSCDPNVMEPPGTFYDARVCADVEHRAVLEGP